MIVQVRIHKVLKALRTLSEQARELEDFELYRALTDVIILVEGRYKPKPAIPVAVESNAP